MKTVFKALCAVALAATGSGLIHAQTIAPMVTNFNYSGYEVSYTEGGDTKTVPLTAEATTPDHIIALLKAVYTDPTIPGVWWGYDYNGKQVRRLDYNAYANQGTPWTKGNDTYANPEQDGMTLLLVQMKEGWTSKTPNGKKWNDYDYIQNAYSSVKLITNFTRVHDKNNPGYLYSIDGATNRFFFISKGKPRTTNSRPLYRLFEQISPVNTSDGSHATTSFIDEMKDGNTYLCYHDCGDVGTVGAGHWFTISKDGTAFSLKNLTIFIPDRRFEDNRTDENNGNYFCFYGNSNHTAQQHNDLMPKVLMYTAKLEAKATPLTDTKGYFRVDLDWNTSFTHDKIGADVPEHFYVYILNEDNSRTLIEKVTKNEDGLVVTKHHDYLVQQTTEEQTIHYVVTAQTINRDNNGNIIMHDGKPLVTLQAESNVCEVTIPDYSPFFTQASEYRSRYDIPNEVNIYKNKVSIRPTSQEDFAAIKNNQEEYEVTRTDANGVKKTIAWVKFTQTENQEGYDYTVRYNDETQVTDLVFDDEQPSTSGHIANFDGSTVIIIDRFTASTQTNDQPDKYTYQFEQNEGKYSNKLLVPVYKTTNEVNGIGYTLDQIKADTDHSLRATPYNEITYHAINDPTANLSEYKVERLDKNNNTFTVSRADHINNSGEYHVFAVGPDGNLNQSVYDTPPKFGPEGGDITVPDKNASVADEVSRYVPVIKTDLFKNDQELKHNTYGCDIKQMSYPQLQVTVDEVMKTRPYSGKSEMVMSYQTKLTLTPKLPEDVKNVYYYRVWRKIDGHTLLPETMLNELTDVSGTTNGVEWGSNIAPIQKIYPGSGPIQITDLFTDAMLTEAGKKVTYIVRLYSTTVDGTTGEAIDARKMRSNAEGKDYYVTEQTVEVNFNDDNVITGIEQLAHDGEVESVLYYNLMGVPSTVPYSGINIMSVRYRDGHTTTQKVVR